jgi:arylsulfatase A-like enzyme
MKALVLVLRGLHLGYLGCYGNAWIETSSFDRLAAEGIVFDQHFADSPEPNLARRSWRTGFLPWEKAPPNHKDLLSLLRSGGIQTSLVADVGRGAIPDLGISWDQVRQPVGLDQTLEATGAALDKLTGKAQWLLQVELAGLLPPWEAPVELLNQYLEPGISDEEDPSEEEADGLEPLLNPEPGPLVPPVDMTFLRLQGSYAGVVSHLDSAIGALLDELEERELDEEVLVLVTTDHGYPLGEHGIVGLARPWLHDELIHLPLLLRLPSRAMAGQRVAALTQAVDLFPTLLDVFDLAAPSSHGYSLLPLAHGEKESVRQHLYCTLRLEDREEWAVRTPDWSFLLPVAGPDDPPRVPQLYIKPEDRWEVNNVVQHQLELADQFEKLLRDSGKGAAR